LVFGDGYIKRPNRRGQIQKADLPGGLLDEIPGGPAKKEFLRSVGVSANVFMDGEDSMKLGNNLDGELAGSGGDNPDSHPPILSPRTA